MGLAANKTFGIGANHFCEYLLVAQPDTDVYEKVMIEKKYFYEQYRERLAIKTKPHITVANFLAKEEMEPTLIRWMHRIISTQKSFKVTLCNYSGFPPHTVYLRVQEPEPFQQLAKELKPLNEYIRSNDCPAIKLIGKPHLSIARKLPEAIYEKAMMDYSQRCFLEYFDVNDLILLRRQSMFDKCVEVNKFGLRPV